MDQWKTLPRHGWKRYARHECETFSYEASVPDHGYTDDEEKYIREVAGRQLGEKIIKYAKVDVTHDLKNCAKRFRYSVTVFPQQVKGDGSWEESLIQEAEREARINEQEVFYRSVNLWPDYMKHAFLESFAKFVEERNSTYVERILESNVSMRVTLTALLPFYRSGQSLMDRYKEYLLRGNHG